MTIGNDGNAPSRQREGTTPDDQPRLRRWPAMRIGIGIAVLILIMAGIYLYASRESDNDITGNNEPHQAAENKPAPPPQPPAPSAPSTAQTPSGSQPPSAAEPAAPERSASQPPPDQTAQTPAAEPPPAQPQPMRQQSTNLPEATDMMAVRVGSANVRAAPSLRARVVVTAHKGTRLKVLSRSGKWVQVETEGRTGWINGKMLSPE